METLPIFSNRKLTENMVRFLGTTLLILLLCASTVRADLNQGDALPNPTLKSMDGEEVALHDLLKKVTVIHLWKCN